MAITYDGTTVQNITYDGSTVQRVTYDGVEVWSSGPSVSELVFSVDNESLTVALPFAQSSANAITIDWGDNSSSTNPSALSDTASHTYSTAGQYTVTISCESGETWNIGVSDGSSSVSPTVISASFANDVLVIDKSAFRYCVSLTTIAYPQRLTTIGNAAFDGCTALQYSRLPNTVTSIGNSAYRNCTSLTRFDVPPLVTAIGSRLLNGCSNITIIQLPSAITSIDSVPFNNCSSLLNFVCGAVVPPTLVSSSLNGIPSNCVILVPNQSVETYKSAQYWSVLAEQIVGFS